MKSIRIACLLLLPAFARAETRALIAVGSHEGLAGEEKLLYAGRDAQRFAEVMVRLGDVRPENATVLVDPDPAALEAALIQMAQTQGEDLTFFLYFSGHGDEDALHLAGRRLPLAHLDTLLASVPARLRITVLDACRSEGGRREKGLVEAQPFEIDATPRGPAGDLRVRSSAKGEASQESDQLEGAVFTHAWVSGLAGAADQNGDAQVTFDEAYAHAHAATLRRSAATAAGLQRAAVEMRVAGEAPLVLTRLARSAGLVLPASGEEVLYLVYAWPAGTPVAALSTRETRRLAVPGGRYLVQRRAPPRFGAAEVRIGEGEDLPLTEGAFTELPLARLVEKGGHLVLHPHAISVGYGLQTDVRGGLGHRAELRYDWRPGELGLAAIAGATFHERAATHHDIAEQSVRAAARLTWWPGGGEFHLGSGPEIRFVFQELTRNDAAALAGLDATLTSDYQAFTGGLSADVGYRLPLTATWFVGFDLDTALLVVKEENVALRLDAHLGLLGGARF